LIKLTLLIISLIAGQTVVAAPLVPQFRSGEMRINSTSTSVLTETVTSQSFNTGYTYSASGMNVKPTTGTLINPSATSTTSQTVNGVDFSWTSPQLESIPQWQIVNEAAPFSLIEHVTAPGLENITTITRTVETTQVSESVSIFGQ
tara:strand:+ start:515 stop:952 length:438 start_codon:yes stop_codon:yes gene_type:complete